MIGDSGHDAEGTQNAGIDFIAVTYGYGFKSFKDAQKYHPVLTVSKLKELKQYFVETSEE